MNSKIKSLRKELLGALFILALCSSVLAGKAPNSAPYFQGYTIASNNSYVDVTFSEAVFGDALASTPVDISAFAIEYQPGGITITSITKTDNTALVGGETVIRFNLNLSFTPDANQTFKLKSSAANVFFNASGEGNINNTFIDILLRDLTPPSFTSPYPTITNLAAYSATLQVNLSESGNAYYVVLPNNATAPSAAQVKAGHDANDNPVALSGTISVAAGSTVYSQTISNLTHNTEYDIYVVAEDNATTPNLMAVPVKLDVLTQTPVLNWSGTVFNEAYANNGSISTTIQLTLLHENFSISSGNFVLNTDYTINNLPAGLNCVITAVDATHATIQLTGNATNHANANDVNNLTIAFTNNAFTLGPAANITNSSRNDLSINFNNEPEIGVTSISAPIQKCSYSANEQVIAVVKNFDAEDFNFAQDTLFVFTEITFPNNSKDTISEIITSGTLASLATMNITFTETVNMTATGAYSFRTWIVINADKNLANNEITKNILYSVPTVNLGNDQTLCASQSVILDAQNPGANYLWSTGATTQTITVDSVSIGIGFSDISVTVTVNNCTATDDVRITFIAEPVFDLGANFQLCVGESQTLNAGITNVDYNWSVGATTASVILSQNNLNVGANTVSLTVTDANNCTYSDNVIVTLNQLPVADAGANNSVACGGSIQIGTPAVAGHTYYWAPASSLDNASLAQPTATLTGTTVFTLTVTNTTTGCSATDDVTITVTGAPVATITGINSICEGESTTLTASGGTSYLWSNNSTNATINVTPSTTTTYTVTVANGNCYDTESITVTVKPIPVVSLDNNPTTVCANQTITLNANITPAYDDLIWSTGATTQSIQVDTTGIGLGSATFSVSATLNGCQNADTITLTFVPVPTFSLGNDVAICYNQNYVLYTTISNAQYLWSTGNTTMSLVVDISNLNYGANTISLQVTDNNGCSFTDDVVVTLNPAPIANAGPDVAVNCGNSATLGTPALSNHTYTWEPALYLNDSTIAQPTCTPQMNQSYILTVVNTQTGCSKKDTVNVTINDLPTPVINGNTNICYGEEAMLVVSGGSTYLWSTLEDNDTIYVSPADNSTYYVTVTEGNCSAVASITVNVKPLPVVNLGNDITICSNGSATINAGLTADAYLWSTGETTSSIVVDTTGHGFNSFIIALTATVNGCSASDTLQVSVAPLPTIELGNPVATCYSSSITINAGAGAASYLWSTGASTQSITVDTASVGTGSSIVGLTITDACGIAATDQIEVLFHPDPVVDFGSDTIYTSQPDTLVFTASGFDSYLWSNGSTNNTLQVSGFGWVSLTVTQNDCQASDSVYITMGYDLALHAIDAPNSACTLTNAEQVKIKIKNTGNLPIASGETITVSYKIGTFAAVTENITLAYDLPVNGILPYTFNTTANLASVGPYNFKVYLSYVNDTKFVNDTLYKTVNNWGTPNVNLGPDQVKCDNETVTLNAGVGVGFTYIWSTGATTSSITLDTTGIGFSSINVSVTVTNAGGCKGTDEINIRWEQCTGCVACAHEVLSGSSGYIRIGQYGSQYAHNLTYCPNSNCSWKVTSTTNMNKIAITFDYFDIRYGDYLKIYKGHTANSANLIGTYNILSMPPAMIVVPSDSVYLTFTSDNSVEGYGASIYLDGFGIGVTENEINEGILVYPNPAHSSLNIRLANNNFEDAEVSLLNTIGQEVLKTRIAAQFATMNVENLNKGLYILQIKSSEKILTRMISIQ